MQGMWKIWLRPRTTLAGLATRPKLAAVLPLGAVWGLERKFHGLLKHAVPEADLQPIISVAAENLLFGTIFGLSMLWIASWAFSWSARRLGSEITSDAMRVVLAWSAVPRIPVLVLLVVLLFALGDTLLLHDRRQLMTLAPGFLLPFIGVWMVCSIWSVVIAVGGLAEVGRISIGRSLGAYAIGGLILVLPLLAAVFARASLS